mgnify:FL=1|tara:strand:- start:4007 stop:4483 length:477 start_codon:yes stop_codon:yes gene_type:complete
MKNLYIVKNITSTESISVGVFTKEATIGTDTYTLIKTDSDKLPTGESVEMLSYDEFNANIHSFTFGGNNGDAFRKEELRFSEELATAFSSAQAGLSSSNGNALFDILADTSHRISRGQTTLAYTKFNEITNPLVTQQMKDFLNDMFLEHFNKIPRDLN